jgi:lactocepin
VIGSVSYTDTFGAPRQPNRKHLGQDLMGKKMQPLVAAADATVTYLTIPEASWGYEVSITDAAGWKYNYLHVNNDTPGTDDGNAPLSDVFAPGIAKGTKVVAGQLIAYMGDSGNAEDAGAHLHFELQDPSGAYVNSFNALGTATKLTAAVTPGGTASKAASTPSAAALPRLAGGDRIATALAASQSGWTAAPAVVLANGDQFAEALPASVLAAKLGGPLLLTESGPLRADVLAEIQRLQAKAVTVVGSVPAAVDSQLQALGITVTRVGGTDAVATAAAVALLVGASGGTAILVNSDRFADAVSAAGLAAGRGWPILLSSSSKIPQATVDTWRALGVTRVLLMGGTAVLADNIAHFVPGAVRVAGGDRYATSVAAAELSLSTGGRSVAQVLLATGTNFPDGLTAGTLAARRSGVVVLVDGSGAGTDGASRSFLAGQTSPASAITVLGGSTAVSSAAEDLLATSLHH